MYTAQMRLNILLGIFLGICIVCVHCVRDSNNEENLNAEANQPLVKSACEKIKLQVVCPRGKVINIIQANYGSVNDLAKCNPKKNKKFNTKCKSSKSLTVMRQKCHQKRECSVNATNSVFGDPCPTTIKYLEVRYKCVAEVAATKIPPRKITPKKVATTKIPPKKVTPKKVATTKIPPKKITPKKVETTKIPPKKVTPRATTPKTVATKKIPPKKVTPRATTPKMVPTTKIPPKKVTPRATTPKSKETTIKLTTRRPTPKITPKTLATFTTEKPTPKVGTKTTTKLTTEKFTPKAITETTAKLTTEKLTPKVSTETTLKSTTERPTPKVSTFEDTTLREVTTVEQKSLSKHACEHDMLHIECEVGKIIRVLRANYGRTSTEVCSQSIAKHWNINCVYNKTEEIMRKMCDGKKNCNVAAENSVFTDTCQNTLKYLEVNYLCEDEITTQPPSTSYLNIESSITTTEIPKTTQEIPTSTTLKCLTEVLTKTDVTTTSETPKDKPTSSSSPPPPEATSTHEPTPPVPLTTKEIPILSTPKPRVTSPETTSKPRVTSPETSSEPRVTAPETSCSEEDLDCIIDDLGNKPDWFTCEKDMASYPHPASKKLFIFCLNWKPFVKKCGQERVFSEKLMTCINP